EAVGTPVETVDPVPKGGADAGEAAVRVGPRDVEARISRLIVAVPLVMIDVRGAVDPPTVEPLNLRRRGVLGARPRRGRDVALVGARPIVVGAGLRPTLRAGLRRMVLGGGLRQERRHSQDGEAEKQRKVSFHGFLQVGVCVPVLDRNSARIRFKNYARPLLGCSSSLRLVGRDSGLKIRTPGENSVGRVSGSHFGLTVRLPA